MDKDLQHFLLQWRQEIQHTLKGGLSNQQIEKQEVVPVEPPQDGLEGSETASPPKRFHRESLTSEVDREKGIFTIDIKPKTLKSPPGVKTRMQKYFDDEEVEEDGQHVQAVDQRSKGGGCADSTSKRRNESFVDKLIEDLDDINTVPFFDVQLPKEIALKIFSHLSMSDLGRCAQVSRSWKALSEDCVLWSRLCHKMGYELDMDASDYSSWKLVVRRIIEKDRKVLQNWKERNCGLTEHQPRTTGILSVVDMYDSVIVAGYSSGAVCMWDLTVDNKPIEMSQPPGDAAGSQPSCATVRGNVVAVGTKGGIIKMFNTYGLSQEHEITCPHKEPVTHISSAAIDQSPFIAASFGSKKYMVIWGSHDNQWHFKIFPPKDPHDGPIEDIFTVGLQREQDPCGVVVCHRNRISLQTLNGDFINVVTSTDRHSSVYFTSHSDTLLGQVDVRESSGQLAWGSGVKSCEAIKIYDYTRGLISQSISCRQRHVVTALNFGDSPPNMVVSGNTDYKVMVHDIRSPDLVVMVLKGHDDVITDVQMDEWKVTSGSKDGSSVVWDQRMCSLLWQTNARHPVRKCRFQGNYLVTANIPINTNPDLVYSDYDWEPLGGHQRSIPTRYLGLLRVFDFSVDPLHYSKVLPSICSSAYNEPAASNYNMDLIVPYDDIVDQDVM